MMRALLPTLLFVSALLVTATASSDVVPECPEGSQPEALGGEWNHGGFRCVNEDGEEVTEDDGGLCSVGGRLGGGAVPVVLSLAALVAASRRPRG